MFFFTLPFEVYVFILAGGILLNLVKEFLDLDVLGGTNVANSVSVGVLMWGIVGIVGVVEPIAVVVSFLGFGVITYLIFNGLVIAVEIEKDYIGFIGKINMRIDPGAQGKISIKSERGVEFFSAKASEKLVKPLQIGKFVKIVKFDHMVAEVVETNESSSENKVKQKNKMGVLSSVLMLVKNRKTKNNKTCVFCYQKIEDKLYSQCDKCQTQFHRNHLEDWLKLNNSCPNCRVVLS